MKIIHFEWPWRLVLQQELYRLYRVFPSKAFLSWEICAKPASDIFLVHLLCSCLYHLAKWPCAISVILAFIVAFETAFCKHSVHRTVSPLTNRFVSVTGIRTLGFGRRRYGRLFLAIAALLVQYVIGIQCTAVLANSMFSVDYTNIESYLSCGVGLNCCILPMLTSPKTLPWLLLIAYVVGS